MVVCAEAALIYHYESLQFKGFCDTIFFQENEKKFYKTESSSFNLTVDFRFDSESQMNRKRSKT